MTTAKANINSVVSLMGQRVLFIGVECFNWSVQDIVAAAKNAKAMGFDTICIKRSEGIFKWYKTPAQLAIEKRSVEALGIKYRSFGYIYGPRFGDDQIVTEANILKEMGSVTGLCIADMEVEWNGNPGGAAAKLAAQMATRPAPFIVSTWADPVQQNWQAVISGLDPVVDAWGPQQYTEWLSTQEPVQWNAETRARIMPEIDITNIFVNNPIQVMKDSVARGHKSIWIWEYQIAMKQPNIVRQLLALMPSETPLVTKKPVVLPVPTHNITLIKHKYTIQPGDTLSGIAAKLKLANWFQDLYQPNKNVLDAAAAARGQHDSRGGALIYPGTVLTY